jgi:hypothetical protein
MVYVAIIGGVAAFVGLVALWGWWRYQLELEGQQIVRTMGFAYQYLADEARRKAEQEGKEKRRSPDTRE